MRERPKNKGLLELQSYYSVHLRNAAKGYF
jgi:hypothetical protein